MEFWLDGFMFTWMSDVFSIMDLASGFKLTGPDRSPMRAVWFHVANPYTHARASSGRAVTLLLHHHALSMLYFFSFLSPMAARPARRSYAWKAASGFLR